MLISIDEVGTDSREYDNMTRSRKAGKFAGRMETGLLGNKIPETTSGLEPLINSVVGSLLAQPIDTLKANIAIAKGELGFKTLKEGVANFADASSSVEALLRDFDQRFRNIKTNPILNTGTPKAPRAYKARPLTGIWATAPFLHNGSIPNLKEILLPAGKRSKTFRLGTREYDTTAVGYLDVEKFDGKPSFVFDTSLPGNSNAGHEYGTKDDQLTDDQRMELLEYLKSL